MLHNTLIKILLVASLITFEGFFILVKIVILKLAGISSKYYTFN